MKHHPFSMIAIAIYAGFNALLLIITGLLMAFSRQTTEPAGWLIACGLVFLTVGVFIGTAIYGLRTRHDWGRKILCGGLLFCIPLNVVAIFPVLQNHRMTTGNTLLQMACVVASSAAIFYLVQNRFIEGPIEERRSHDSGNRPNRSLDEEDRPFTFDRNGHEGE